jgi:hypothetical protein
MYGESRGDSERFLGEALRDRREAFLAMGLG